MVSNSQIGAFSKQLACPRFWDDPAILDEIKAALCKTIGYARRLSAAVSPNVKEAAHLSRLLYSITGQVNAWATETVDLTLQPRPLRHTR